MERGELWWARLPAPAGSEPGYRRPVLVVSADAFNRSAIQTVTVVAVTTNVRLAQAPGNVLLSKKGSRLPETSVANVSQVLTLDKAMLEERVGRLTPALLEQVEQGLRLALDL